MKQTAGSGMNETAACIKALLGMLKPHYDEQSSPQEASMEQSS